MIYQVEPITPMNIEKKKRTRVLEKNLRRFFFLLPAVFYFFTASRTPGWLDAGMIASNVANLQLGSWVNFHNLFNLLGFLWLKLFPGNNVHFYLVLLGGLFGTVTVHYMFLVGLELTSHPISAAIGAVALMVSHSLWWHSTMLEVYTLNTALLAIFLYAVVRYNKTKRRGYLYLSVFFFGLGCSNHVLVGLFIPAFILIFCILLFRSKEISGKHLLILAGCFLLGFQLYLFIFIRDFLDILRSSASDGGQTGLVRAWASLREVLHGATGGDFKEYMFNVELPLALRRFYRFAYVFWWFYNYASPAFFLGFWGILLFWKKKKYRLLFWFFILGIAVQILWSANYFIWDMYAFSLPVYVMFSLPVTLALDRLLYPGERVRKIILVLSITLLIPVLLYQSVSGWYRKGGFFKWFFDSFPETEWIEHTWEPVEYFSKPNKRNYDKVERYVTELLSVLPQKANLLDSDCRADYALRFYYRDIKQIRTDIIHHDLFSPFMTKAQGKQVAKKLKRKLENGEPVFSVSVGYPEKVVLDQLYLMYDPSKDQAWLDNLSLDGYLESFPRVRFDKIVLFADEEIWIYEMLPEAPDS